MITLDALIKGAANKEGFQSIQNYIDFSLRFLEYINSNKQAEIIAQNDHAYRFYQFNSDAAFKVTRPFNANLLYSHSDAETQFKAFVANLGELKKHKSVAEIPDKSVINNTVYTLQQSIGFALDAGTATVWNPMLLGKSTVIYLNGWCI